MSKHEQDNFGSHETYDAKSLERVNNAQQERIKENLERSVETKNPEHLENARHEALEQASSAEVERKAEQSSEKDSPLEHRRPRSRKEKDASFEATMAEVRSQMSAPSRVFSTIIHNPVVEKTSDVVGSTIARPNAILSGAVFAFVFTLIIYLVARFYGYPLSGGETIASFAAGWALGLVFDYIRLLLFGKGQS